MDPHILELPITLTQENISGFAVGYDGEFWEVLNPRYRAIFELMGPNEQESVLEDVINHGESPVAGNLYFKDHLIANTWQFVNGQLKYFDDEDELQGRLITFLDRDGELIFPLDGNRRGIPRSDWNPNQANYQDDYHRFCEASSPYSLGSLRKILDHLGAKYKPTADRAKLCRILHHTVQTYLNLDDADVSDCLNDDDLVTHEPLKGRKNQEVIKISTAAVGTKNKNCYMKGPLKSWLHEQKCKLVGDAIISPRGNCIGALRETISDPDLVEVLKFDKDHILDYI